MAIHFRELRNTGATIAAGVLAQLTGRTPHSLRETRRARQLARAVAAYAPPKTVRRIVIALDNIAKVTKPKLDLIRLLRESPGLAFVAIVEHFTRDEDLMRMRIALDPAIVVKLGALDAETSARFFATAAAEFHLSWNESDVALLAHTLHGYPLEMVRTVRAAQRRAHEVRS